MCFLSLCEKHYTELVSGAASDALCSLLTGRTLRWVVISVLYSWTAGQRCQGVTFKRLISLCGIWVNKGGITLQLHVHICIVICLLLGTAQIVVLSSDLNLKRPYVMSHTTFCSAFKDIKPSNHDIRNVVEAHKLSVSCFKMLILSKRQTVVYFCGCLLYTVLRCSLIATLPLHNLTASFQPMYCL